MPATLVEGSSHLFTSCRNHGVARLQVDINVTVDVLIPCRMKDIVKLVQIVKHTLAAKQFCRLLARQGLINLIAFKAKHSKSSLLAHICASSHIGKFDFPCSFFLLQEAIQHIRAVLPDLCILLLKSGVQL